MRFEVPDPRYSASRRAAGNFVLAFRLVFGFLVVVWSVFLFDQMLQLELIRFGLRPRESAGLIGLATTPLLHFDLSHLMSNTLPLLIGGTLMLYLFPNASLRVLPLLFVGTSALAWIFARDHVHIGASGLIYGILAFVFVSGLLRRDLRSVGAALLVWFLYGSMLWGVLPSAPATSWELHASGLVLGVLCALVFRAWDRPPMKRYDWEDEDDELDDEIDAPWRQFGNDRVRPSDRDRLE
ncbi:rhomboid family intramembrane serine protease [Wenzhouxiangella sp. XN79A]|uniref:rhomboid family intramembrane serine protease n=1 Tax=Wenzhouxiangella sp. XN79A TaxID=2724193 RepID=UPI00144AF649|nr:rhomboid family intramembrane serine protease [Wenzhouxiangella sp. XN79A]NKI34450.1 rhomboid family intramembrane serine protease [Wenzhouxiangella sp. XN79A]